MPEIDVIVEDAAWAEAIPDPARCVRQAAAAALHHAVGADAAEVLEVAVALADDATIRDLNRRFRGKDAPTNVLAFPAEVPPPRAGPVGDVILARETCLREAAAQGKPAADHLRHLVVHGVLHLLGRDHDQDEAAERMEPEERLILHGLGVADPYRGTDEAAEEPGRRP